MSETVITVRGEHTAEFTPEHAIVSSTVAFDGRERDHVFARASEVASLLESQLAELHDPTQGPVTRWSAERARVWSQRPWNDQGRQLPAVFHAQLQVSATFVDTEALARWVEHLATTDGVNVDGIAWGLSDAREKAALVEVRRGAVTDAVERAQAFAAALGLSGLTPIALADPGMLGDQPGGAESSMIEVASMRAMKDAGGELAFTPRDIELSAAVDARFVASA
ncbi:SIMPL domain-containing protein [uncultured Schumannella sp.]|uniref:SIMPL domain-containing protein n=1 Tax=uncultured Schumannella sp. TaxID=1195956 RepID=UPI0025EE4C31|nr:SIMPL domain-containing protein [uncultured Schumannella sp.]